MNIVLLGYPGSGKGTQAKLLSKRKNFIHISTGDLFREEISKGSELGKKVSSYISSGKLVPDDLFLNVIREKIKDIKDNILFDGFPRTVEQAERLEDMLGEFSKTIDKVFFFEVNEAEVIKRISSRRNCPKCGKIYNLVTEPPKDGVLCDICKVKLVQRDDDKEDVVKNRIEVYKDLTAPLISYYRTQGIFVIIDATKNVEEVYSQIVSNL
ncbi:MAG: adenylate kinase [Elusimicrobiales bacterium]|nr:adenylate kinase [Elusimicrobiales bacterium]